MGHVRNGAQAVKRLLSLFLLLPTLLWAGQGMGPGPGALSYGTTTISPSLVLTRSSCTAPCGVIGDASGTTDAATTSIPFQDLQYTIDWGDATAGAWTTGTRTSANSKNTSYGPIGAHVYETNGSYTVTLTVCDSLTCAAPGITTASITVAAANTTFSTTATECFATSGNYAGCPTGATTHGTATGAWNTLVAGCIGSNKRCLFRTGETWTITNTASISSAGPWQVGGFGGGKANVRGVNTAFTDIMDVTTGVTEGAIYDIAFDGQNFANAGVAAVGGTGASGVTILRVDAQHINRGYAWDGCKFVVSDSSFSNGVTTNNIALYTPAIGGLICDYNAIIGNSLDTGAASNASETTRFPYLRKAVISNNNILGPGPSFDAIKLHNISSGGTWGGNYTELDVIAENYTTPGSGPTVVTLGPQNSSSDERLRNIVIERNLISMSSNTVSGLIIEGVNMTVRNNTFYGDTADSVAQVKTRGTEPAPDSIKFYNNSAYRSSASFSFGCLDFINGTNHQAYNNLCWSPNLAGATMFKGTTGLTQSNNSTNTQVRQVTNPFVGTPTSPSVITNFQNASGSYAAGAGLNTIKVYRDIVNTQQTNPPALGAYIQ